MIPIFERSFPSITIINYISPDILSKTIDQYNIDYITPIGSLPKYFRRSADSFINHEKYILDDEINTAKWKSRYKSLKHKYTVGISWHGGKKDYDKRIRSIDLDKWITLLNRNDINIVNLQYGDTSAIIDIQSRYPVIINDWDDSDPLTNIDDFCSKIAALDLVITVDNSTAHFAGALGIPTWLLLPKYPDWRWREDGERTLWYPSINLIRQNKIDQWDNTFIRCYAKLNHEIGNINNTDGTPNKLKCAIITPISPGHEELVMQCAHSVKSAANYSTGPFTNIIHIKIDDSHGLIGRSKARNDGVKKAHQDDIDWIFFLDADDLIMPDAFSTAANYVHNYDAIWGQIICLDPDTNNTVIRHNQLHATDNVIDIINCDPFLSIQMGHFVKTACALSLPFDQDLDVGEDFDYYLRAWTEYRCVKVDKPLFINRRGSHSIGPRSGNGSDWRQAALNIIQQYDRQYIYQDSDKCNRNTDCFVLINRRNVTSKQSNKTIESINFAINHSRGMFDNITIINHIVDRVINQNIWPIISSDNDSNYDPWLLFIDDGDILLNNVFNEIGSYTPHYESVWGLDCCINDDSSMNIIFPQVLTATHISELICFDPQYYYNRHFFSKASIFRDYCSKNNNTFIPDMYFYDTWDNYKSIKSPFAIAARDGNNIIDAELHRSCIAEALSKYNLHPSSNALLNIRNRKIDEMANFSRENELIGANEYFSIARAFPFKDIVDINCFPGNSFMMFNNGDDMVVDSVIWTGGYENTSMLCWYGLSLDANLIIDIGSYTGIYSIIASVNNNNCNIISIEPLPDNYARLCINVKLNNCSNIQAYCVAASDKDDNNKINIYSNGDFLTSGASMENLNKNKIAQIVAIQSIRLSSLMSNRKDRIDLIKLDAENHEHAIINDIMELLDKDKPDIIIEILEPHNAMRISRLLSRIGYNFYIINDTDFSIELIDGLDEGVTMPGTFNRLVTTKSSSDLSSIFTSRLGSDVISVRGKLEAQNKHSIN